MEVSEAKRLHELELENSKLKRLLAEADAGQRCAQGWCCQKSGNACPSGAKPWAGLRSITTSASGEPAA